MTAVGAREQGVLAIEREWTDGALAVELDPAVVEEAGQAFPAGECVAGRLGKRALSAELSKLGVEEAAERDGRDAGCSRSSGQQQMRAADRLDIASSHS